MIGAIGVQRVPGGVVISLISPDGAGQFQTVCAHQAVAIGEELIREGGGTLRVRASNVMVDVLPPCPSEGELEPLLYIGDEFTRLTIVGDPRNMRAIATAINDRLDVLEAGDES